MAEVSAWVSILRSPLGPSWGSVHSIAASPDGSLVVMTSASDPNMVLWDIGSESPTLLSKLDVGATHVEWSPSGHWLFSGST